MTFKSFLTISALSLSALTWNSATRSSYEISDQTVFTTAINSSPAIVKFSAAWCGPCKQMAPMFEEVSNQAQYQTIKFIKVDTDKASPLANMYNIRSVPTTIFFKNGKEVGRISGAPSRNDFINKIRSYFAI